MTALRLLVTGLGLLLPALLLVTSSSSWTDPSVLAARSWVLPILVGCGLTVSAALISALSTERTAPAAEPAVDHHA